MNTEEKAQNVADVEVVSTEPSDTAGTTNALIPQDIPAKTRGRKKTEIDETLFDEAIVFIRDKMQETIFKGSIEIGEYIFQKFYDGNRDLVTSRDPKKEFSLRKLAERPNCPITYAAISNMVRVALQERFLIEQKIDSEKLHYTHKIKLLAIRDSDEKAAIATEIIENQLSTRDAGHLITSHRSKEPAEPKEKKTRVSDTVKIMRYLLDSPRFRRFDFEENSITHLDSEERKELKEEVTEAIQELKRLSAEYKKVLSAIEKVEKGSSSEGVVTGS